MLVWLSWLRVKLIHKETLGSEVRVPLLTLTRKDAVEVDLVLDLDGAEAVPPLGQAELHHVPVPTSHRYTELKCTLLLHNCYCHHQLPVY